MSSGFSASKQVLINVHARPVQKKIDCEIIWGFRYFDATFLRMHPRSNEVRCLCSKKGNLKNPIFDFQTVFML